MLHSLDCQSNKLLFLQLRPDLQYGKIHIPTPTVTAPSPVAPAKCAPITCVPTPLPNVGVPVPLPTAGAPTTAHPTVTPDRPSATPSHATEGGAGALHAHHVPAKFAKISIATTNMNQIYLSQLLQLVFHNSINWRTSFIYYL